MELPFLTNRRSANQRVSRFLLKMKTYRRVHNRPLDINPQADESSPHLTIGTFLILSSDLRTMLVISLQVFRMQF